MRIISSIGLSIGRDHGSPVSLAYRDEFAFEGHLSRLDIQLVAQGVAHSSEQDETAAREGMARQ
jgi:hypothetical protein